MRWTFAVGDAAPATAPDRELTAARSRKLTFRLDGAASAEFTIDGRHDEAGAIADDLARDLWVWRDAELMFRGRIVSTADTISETRHTIRAQAVDYRGILSYRLVRDSSGDPGTVYPAGTTQGALTWDIVDNLQAVTGGDYGIANGLGSGDTTPRERTIAPGKFAGEELALIGRLDGGYEWTISPELELDRWPGGRGADNGVVLDHGGMISSLTRRVRADDYGNVVLVTGATGLTPVEDVDAGIGTDPRGRFEIVESFPSIINQPVLDDRAPALLALTSNLRPLYAATIAPVLDSSGERLAARSRWEGPSHLWIGDTGRLIVRSGVRYVDDNHRLIELAVALDDDGNEDIDLGLRPA